MSIPLLVIWLNNRRILSLILVLSNKVIQYFYYYNEFDREALLPINKEDFLLNLFAVKRGDCHVYALWVLYTFYRDRKLHSPGQLA